MATTAPTQLTEDLMLLLGQTAHALSAELTAGLEGLGISPRGHCVLTKALSGELTQGEVAQLCDLDKTTMVVTMDELERAGLAERRPATADRRARIIAVTPAGKRKAAEAAEIVASINDDVLSALPARERQAFVHALERLAEGRLSAPAKCERPVRRPRSASALA